MINKIGDLIRKYRTDRKISQMTAELELELSPGSLSRIENEVINPNKETIIKIAQYLNIPTFEVAQTIGLDIDMNEIPEIIAAITPQVSGLLTEKIL